MIDIAVSVRRAFTLPVGLAAARRHFRDFRQILEYLPDLRLVKTYARDQYRILYSATHAGVYRVDLYSDVWARFDQAENALCVTPLQGFAPVASKATPASLTGQGDYSSRLSFRSAGARTDANYELQITAALPTPIGLKLVPNPAVRLFVERVVRRRVREITDAFVQRSTERLQPRHCESS
jgi:hypothetical protein